jgi:hypothetical protein
MGYHNREIPRGIFGEFSKVIEEFEEAKDAREQNNPVMELVELCDLIGAIEGYTLKHFNLGLRDLTTFVRTTERVFKDGTRKPRT